MGVVEGLPRLLPRVKFPGPGFTTLPCLPAAGPEKGAWREVTCAGAGPEGAPGGFREAARRRGEGGVAPAWGSRPRKSPGGLQGGRGRAGPGRALGVPGDGGGSGTSLSPALLRGLFPAALSPTFALARRVGQAGSSGYRGSRSRAGQRRKRDFKSIELCRDSVLPLQRTSLSCWDQRTAGRLPESLLPYCSVPKLRGVNVTHGCWAAAGTHL